MSWTMWIMHDQKNNPKGYRMYWFFEILLSYTDGSESRDKCYQKYFSASQRKVLFFGISA